MTAAVYDGPSRAALFDDAMDTTDAARGQRDVTSIRSPHERAALAKHVDEQGRFSAAKMKLWQIHSRAEECIREISGARFTSVARFPPASHPHWELAASGRRQFQLLEAVGRGGFGQVHRALMQVDGVQSTVAVKLLRDDVSPDGQAVARLRDEARWLSGLQHPGIVRVIDLMTVGGRPALVTEFIEGWDLRSCLKGGATLPPAVAFEVAARVAHALHVAHQASDGVVRRFARVVHRDVKPANILVGIHGEVKLLDFGIAHALESVREAHTRTDLLVGSPAYMAPERMTDARVGPGADVFGLAATLWQALSGEKLLPGSAARAAAFAVDRKRFEKLVDERSCALRNVLVPSALATLKRALSFDARQRPPADAFGRWCETMAAMFEGPDLRQWCADREAPSLSFGARPPKWVDAVPVTVELSPVRRKRHSARRRPMWVLLGLVGAAMAWVAGRAWQYPDAGDAGSAATESPTVADVQRVQAWAPVEVQPERAHIARPPRSVPRRTAKPAPPFAGLPATARVHVQGDARVVLVNGLQRVAVPAEVALGRWEVHADFGDAVGLRPIDQPLELRPNREAMVRCDRRMARCRVLLEDDL